MFVVADAGPNGLQPTTDLIFDGQLRSVDATAYHVESVHELVFGALHSAHFPNTQVGGGEDSLQAANVWLYRPGNWRILC